MFDGLCTTEPQSWLVILPFSRLTRPLNNNNDTARPAAITMNSRSEFQRAMLLADAVAFGDSSD